MKQTFIIILAIVLGAVLCHAEQKPQPKPHPGFSPQQYMKEQEKFITEEVGLTVGEAKKFFPRYNKFKESLRSLDGEMWKLRMQDDKELTEAQAREIMEQIQSVEQRKYEARKEFAEKMQKQIGALKLLKILNADKRFERRFLRRFMKQGPASHTGNGSHDARPGKDGKH